MPAFIDLTGHTYGRLTVIARANKSGVRTKWRCRCACGKRCVVSRSALRSRTRGTQSCGCLLVEATIARSTKHNHAHRSGASPTFTCWTNMIARCKNERRPDYSYYGGRGITVCDRWRHDFSAFLTDMGPRPSKHHTVDRIEVDGNYEPLNCRWATRKEQTDNRRIAKIQRENTQTLLRLIPRSPQAIKWSHLYQVTKIPRPTLFRRIRELIHLGLVTHPARGLYSASR